MDVFYCSLLGNCAECGPGLLQGTMAVTPKDGCSEVHLDPCTVIQVRQTGYFSREAELPVALLAAGPVM